VTTATAMPALWNVLFDDRESAHRMALKLEAHPDFDDVRERLTRLTVPGFADGIRHALAGQLEALLATPLDEVVGGAFRAWRTLREYRDAKTHPPDEVALVPLLTHTIESTHHPYLEILIDGLPPRRIPFEVRLALVIDGATLQVQAGRIREIRVGSCKGEGSLSCGAMVLVEPKSRSIPLPGVIRFGDGVPITAGN
jgi:hypothetical protein